MSHFCRVFTIFRTLKPAREKCFSEKNLLRNNNSGKFLSTKKSPDSFCGDRNFTLFLPQALQATSSVARKLKSVGIHCRGFSERFTDRSGTVHFRRKGLEAWSPIPGEGKSGKGHSLSERQQKVLIIVGLTGGTLGLVYVTHLQTIPYTNRRHCVLFSAEYEKMIGETEFKQIKADNIRNILPSHHPQAVRVRKIASNIIEAAVGQNSPEHSNAVKYSNADSKSGAATSAGRTALSEDGHPEAERKDVDEFVWGGDEGQVAPPDSAVDIGLQEADSWAEKSIRTSGSGYTAHLQSLEWEVVVIQQPILNAFCIPGGKVVVFTGLLEKMPSDDEIATVIGHEVGHVVARHGLERLTTGIALLAVQFILVQLINMPQLVGTVTDLLFEKPFSRMHEIEADRIGLLLMAAAGYDPRHAPGTYEKLAKFDQSPSWTQYMSTHPSGDKRAQLLRKASSMDEAVKVYERKIEGQQFGNFFG